MQLPPTGPVRVFIFWCAVCIFFVDSKRHTHRAALHHRFPDTLNLRQNGAASDVQSPDDDVEQEAMQAELAAQAETESDVEGGSKGEAQVAFDSKLGATIPAPGAQKAERQAQVAFDSKLGATIPASGAQKAERQPGITLGTNKLESTTPGPHAVDAEQKASASVGEHFTTPPGVGSKQVPTVAAQKEGLKPQAWLGSKAHAVDGRRQDESISPDGIIDDSDEVAEEEDTSEEESTGDTPVGLSPPLDGAAGPSPSPAHFLEETLARPSQGGPPDVIDFDIMIKKMLRIDFKKETFTTDAVIYLKWVDDRVKKWVPGGVKYMEMSSQDARRRIWTPKVEISNEDFGGLSVISSQFRVHSNGTVQKVERALVRASATFDPALFPFDRQTLRIEVASKKYMANSLKLKAAKDAAEVPPDMLDKLGFSLWKSEVAEMTDDDSFGLLKKSRGELKMVVERRSGPFWSVTIMPELMLVAFSYTVFIFPTAAAFVMPRVATTMISFLTLMALTLKTSTILPLHGGPSWMAVFEECCTSLVWSASWFNILIMVALYDYKEERLAMKLQREVFYLFPVVTLLAIVVLALAVDFLEICSIVMRILILGGIGGHICFSMYRIYKTKKEEY